MMLRAGELDQRVTVETKQDWLGEWGRDLTWQPLMQVWAKVEPKSAGESSSNGPEGVAAKVTYDVQIRYRAGITTEARLNWGGRVLDITSVIDPTNQKRELNLVCVEHLNNEAE